MSPQARSHSAEVAGCAHGLRSAPARRVHAVGRVLELGERPWLMGIVNASPDSFSDGGRHPTPDAQVQLARELLGAGAVPALAVHTASVA